MLAGVDPGRGNAACAGDERGVFLHPLHPDLGGLPAESTGVSGFDSGIAFKKTSFFLKKMFTD